MIRVYGLLGAILAICAACYGAYYTIDKRGYERGVAFEHAKTLKAEEAARLAYAKAEKAARDIEARQAEQVNKIAESYEQGKRDAQAKADKLVTDLRAGNERLRDYWQDASARCLSNLGATASQLDAARRDREDSAARIVRAGAAADRQIAELQAFIRSERGVTQ